MRDPRRPANGISRSRRCSPVSPDRSTARSTDSLSSVPRVVTLRDAQTNAAGSEVRAAAARHQSASLDKSGLGRRPSLKPPSRATRRRPRERTRATGRLLEHPAEFAHRLHPIRSIEPEPVEDRSQVVRDCPALVLTDLPAGPIEQHDVLLGVDRQKPLTRRTSTRPNSAGRIAVATFPSGRDERWVVGFL